MRNKVWEILNPKHQILNKFEYLNSKFKTNLYREMNTSLFLSFRFWYLVLFMISDLEFMIFVHKIFSNYR